MFVVLVAMGAITGAEFVGIVGNAVFIVVVFHGGAHRFLGKHRAVQFVGRQSVQCFHHRFVGKLERFVNRLAFDHFGRHRGGSDRAPAPEGVELDVGNNAVVVHLDIHFHNIAAFGVANLTNPVGVVHFANVARVLKVVHDLFTVKHISYPPFSFCKKVFALAAFQILPNGGHFP